MKHLVLILAGIGGLVLFCILWLRTDAATNRGRTWGYWGEFNTVSNALSGLPGITIVRPWYNADITLEEFGFELVAGGQKVSLAFGEKDPIRRLSGEQLRKALLEQIAKATSNQSRQPTPGVALAAHPASLARRGCALCWAV